MIRKNIKKKIANVLVVAVLITLAIGGMLAYLTDRDSEVNVFTLGNVQIDLAEEYKQGSELKPGIAVEKKAWIMNSGKSDAWVWMTIAIPAELDITATGETILHWNGPTDTAWNTTTIARQPLQIDNQIYNVYTLLHNDSLKPGEETSLGLNTVHLDNNVDYINDQYYWVDSGSVTAIDYDIAKAKVIVSAYAIQKEGFDSVLDAYNAFQTQWNDNK